LKSIHVGKTGVPTGLPHVRLVIHGQTKLLESRKLIHIVR
jgi:hypothetical protein